MTTIDTRGHACPKPVMMVTKAIKEKEVPFEVLIGSDNALTNVLRTLENFQLKAVVHEEEGYHRIVVEG
jgi:TusA-related sulfurtransferase